MFDTISNDIKVAMKAKDKVKLDTLRMLKSRLIENKTAKAPIPEMDAVIGYYKLLKDSFDAYPEGSEQRQNLLKEMAVVAVYMPQPLGEDDVRSLVKKILQGEGEANFGGVMRALSPEIKGRFDGKRATEIVKEMMGA